MSINHADVVTTVDGFNATGATKYNAAHTVSVSGILKGSAGDVVAATPGTDYLTTVPAIGATTQVTFNNAGTMAGDADLTWTTINNHLEIGLASGSGAVCFPGSTIDEVAEAGELIIYAKNIGGRIMPKWIGPSGVDTPFQPFIGMNRCRMAYGTNATSAVQVFGCAISVTGTATAYTNAITSKYTAMNHVEALVTTPATTAVAGYRDAALDKFLGNAAGMGGFFMVMRGGPATGVSTTTSRFFMGMGPTAAPTDVEPSTISQMIGIGYDAADSQLQFMCKNSGTVVNTALNTTNFPVGSFPLSVNKSVPTADRTDLYELVLFAAPNSAVIYWRATDLISGAQWSGSVTAGTNAGPAVNTALCPKIWSSVGGTSSNVGVALVSYYCETDC